MLQTTKQPPETAVGAPMLAGLLYAIMWLAIGSIALSLLLHFSAMKETSLSSYTLLVHGFAAWCGGFVAAKRSGRKGWYFGAIIGFIYGLIILVAGFLALDNALSLKALLLFAITILAGAIGGMLGVNAKR